MFHRFHMKVGQFCYILLCRRPLCKLYRYAFLLLSINGDLRRTVADAGFLYCQHYFSKRTRCLGRFPELQCCIAMRYTVKPIQTSCDELQDRRMQECRIEESSMCFLDFCHFFLLFDHQEAFHCWSSRSMC